jgi:hypothetical protein
VDSESEPIRRAHPRPGGPGPFPNANEGPRCSLRPLAGRPPAPSGPGQEPPAPLTPSQWQAAAGGKPRRLGVGVAPARTYGHGKPGTVQASAPLATCGIRADGPFGHTASGSQLEPTNRNGFKPGMGFRLLQQNDQCWAHTTAGLPLRCIVRRPPSPILSGTNVHRCARLYGPLITAPAGSVRRVMVRVANAAY